MLVESSLEVVPGFDAYKLKDMIEARPGWSVELIPVGNVELVKTDPGAALECIDGRFDLLPNRRLRGPRVAGGTNLVAAMLTGGDWNGFSRAIKVIEASGYTTGTHGDDSCDSETGTKLPGCVAHHLYMCGKLKTVRYPWEMDKIDTRRFGMSQVEMIKRLQEIGFHGKHFRLNGQHQEQGMRFNPFVGTTERSSSGDRFRADVWFHSMLSYKLGRMERRRIQLDDQVNLKCEIVELAKPDAMKAEILIP